MSKCTNKPLKWLTTEPWNDFCGHWELESLFFLTISWEVLVSPCRKINEQLILAFPPPPNYIWEEVLLSEGSQNIYLGNKNIHFRSFAQTQAFANCFSIMSQYCAQKPENQYTPKLEKDAIPNIFQDSADHPLWAPRYSDLCTVLHLNSQHPTFSCFWWWSLSYREVDFCNRKKGVRTLLLLTTSFELCPMSYRLAHLLTLYKCLSMKYWKPFSDPELYAGPSTPGRH